MANENNKTKERKATSIPKAKKQPLRSGKVKGPMGIGKKQRPSTRATVKEPAKGKVSPAQNPEVSKVSAGSDMEIQDNNTSKLSPAPSWHDQLPERTSNDSEALRVMESKRQRKESQTRHEMASGEPINLSENTQSQNQEMDAKTQADQSSTRSASESDKKKEPSKAPQEKDDSPSQGTSGLGSKKMSRQKFVKGISAEEKLKLDNVSPSQELQNRITQTTKALWEAASPKEQTKDELAKILLEVIPSSQQLASSTPSKEELKSLAERIGSMFEKGANLDEILALIPNEKIREQIQAFIVRARSGM